MNPFQEDTTEFHKAFGHPAPSFPIGELTEAHKDLMKKRAAWIREEADELEEAAEKGDLIGVIDALADAAYFAVGGFTVIGHDAQGFWDNVHRANMNKLDADGNPVPHPTLPGKIGKPEGWIPPEEHHEEFLKEALEKAQIDALALSIARLKVTDPDVRVSFTDVPLAILYPALSRAAVLVKQHPLHSVVVQHEEMLAQDLPYAPGLSIVDDLPVSTIEQIP